MESQPTTFEREQNPFTKEEEEIAKELNTKTINTLTEIQSMENEAIEVMPAEKKKLVVDKIKVVLSLLIVAGVAIVVKNSGALEDAHYLEQATAESIKEGAGTILATFSAIGLGAYHYIFKNKQN